MLHIAKANGRVKIEGLRSSVSERVRGKRGGWNYISERIKDIRHSRRVLANEEGVRE